MCFFKLEMQESKKMKLVAKGLAKWHALPMTSTAATEPSLLETLKKFIENCKKSNCLKI